MYCKFKNMRLFLRLKRKEKQNKWENMKRKSKRLMELFEEI